MNDATQRRAQRARAGDLALAPPASTVYPPTLAQLLTGWPLVWHNPYRDTVAWIGGLSRKGLPGSVKAVLDAVIQADLTLPAVLALADTCDAVVRQGGFPEDVLDAVREIAARARFAAMWLGDYTSSCIAMHIADVAAIEEVDDARRRALAVTAAECSYTGHQILLGTYRADEPVHRRLARDSGWLDLCARAETVEYMRGVDAEPPLGQVRDDTGLDPRDRDEDRAERIVSDLLDEPAARPSAGVVVFPREILAGVGKSENERDVKRLLGDALGAALPRVPVPVDWHAWQEGLIVKAPWLAPAIRAVRATQGGRTHWSHGSVYIAGPAGAGKSLISRLAAQASGLPFARINLDAASDSSVIGGTSIRWSSAHPGPIEALLAKARKASGMLLVDEFEKCAGSRHSGGHPHDLMHGLLEPETARSWRSPYLLGEVDYSHMLYVVTGNSTDGVASSLLDRMTVVRVGEPGPEHLGLLAPALARQACRELGLDERWGDLDREEISALQDAWRGGSVRRLQRLVARILQARDSAPVARH